MERNKRMAVRIHDLDERLYTLAANTRYQSRSEWTRLTLNEAAEAQLTKYLEEHRERAAEKEA